MLFDSGGPGSSVIVSEAVSLLDIQAQGNVANDYSSSSFCDLSRVLATHRSKVIYWRDASPCKEDNALARRPKLDTKPDAGKEFSGEIVIKVGFYDHIVMNSYII